MTHAFPSFSQGYKQPVSGFKLAASLKLAASVHQGKQERSKLTITESERKLLSQQFDSDSSKSESDWESSSDDDYDNDNENENTKRLMSFSLPLKTALPSLTLPQTDNIRTNLAERDSPRTRKFGKVYLIFLL